MNQTIKSAPRENRITTTKEYLLKEYSNVFKATGTFPDESYHIQLKEDYKPVQLHPL